MCRKTSTCLKLGVLEGGCMRVHITAEDILEHIEDDIADGIQVINDEGEVIYCNQAAAALDDITIEDAMGKHIADIYPSLKDSESTLLEVLVTGIPILNYEQTYHTYKGKRITTVNSTRPIIKDGKIVGAVEISRNVTPYVELTERVIDLQSKAQSAEAGVEASQADKEAAAKHSAYFQERQARYTFDDIITVNSEFKRIKSIAAKAARTDIPIFIYGDTGTGKELLTQAVHNASKRSRRPFVAQNCAALPGSLLEGILFGTAKGGFTGAVDRPGLFEIADTGTLFLDEINSMPLELQAKLLRVLQEGKIRRIGENKERRIDVRIIAASNVEPNVALEEGRIRRDLYYRLNTVTLWIPKLADRKEDIVELTSHFIRKYNGLLYRGIKGVTDAVMDLFLNYPWDGNVRELEHIIESAANFAEADVITLQDLPFTLRQHRTRSNSYGSDDREEALDVRLSRVEALWIQNAYEAQNRNVAKAARALGIPRQTLQYKLKKYHIT